jgi:Dehydrogenases with different specificities (related to short-chain alcohol dehydrogenases)
MNTCIIIGASGDIGAAIARKLAGSSNLILTYNENRASALSLASELSKVTGTALYKLDVRKSQDFAEVKAAAEKIFPPAEILVYVSGVSVISLLTDTTDEEIDEVLNVNLRGAVYAAREFIGGMIPRKSGRIIFIGSMWGKSGASCEAVYSAAKAGLAGLTKALAKELGPSGVTVNLVSPGLIDTKMNGNLTREEFLEVASRSPLGRAGTVEEVAEAVKFLAGVGAGYITGETISVDGGMTL